jgi:hypothetical protein
VNQGIIVRRETRADMAYSWVREIARMEIETALAPIKKATKDLLNELVELGNKLRQEGNGLRASIDSVREHLNELERRSGDFTGMSETEIKKFITRELLDRMQKNTAYDLVAEDLHQYYGGSEQHPSFRKRLWMLKNEG